MKKFPTTPKFVWAALIVAITVGAFALAYSYVGPPPPKTLTIASGSKSGAYFRFAQQYAAFLDAKGIQLKIVETSGSIENLKLLEDPESGIDIAFVQGGTGSPQADTDLLSLASLYHEPLWIFHRGSTPTVTLNDLPQLNIAIGAEGSGTRAIVAALLTENGIALDRPNLHSLPSDTAATQLEQGQLDMAMFVSGISAPLIQRLLLNPDIKLLSLERAEAYTRVHRYLDMVILHKGMLDFEENIPPDNIKLLAPVATLVANSRLHPALVDLVLQAATSVHAKPDLLQNEGSFPSARFLEYPLSPDAERYFKYGPPFLQRFLPFWIATLIDRLKVMLIPIIMLILPISKIVPPALKWRTRKRIYHWYGDLQQIDRSLLQDGAEAALNEAQQQLARIEREVLHVKVPLSYADQLYHLRTHIALIREKIQQLS